MIEFEKIKSSIFNDEIIVNKGGWNLTTINNFPECKYLSADTETKLYYNDGSLVDDEQLYQVIHEYKKNKKFQINKYLRENINVKCYAFTLSDGVNFALFQCIEDFIKACCLFKAKRVFWYNAKFDFCIFDYYFLNNNWKSVDDYGEYDGKLKKLPSNTYHNLIGSYGQRYQMRIWYHCKDKKYRNVVRSFKMLDICNIYGGGLNKNLKDWNICEDDGTPLYKLTMSYQSADITSQEDLMYMRNDVVGLHRLAIKIDENLKELTSFSLFKGDFMTAGGLAKKSLLKYMFHEEFAPSNLKLFQKYFPMTANRDDYFRTFKLYKGGICVVNPYKINKEQHVIYKYDSNSMYPDKMLKMQYPFGEAKHPKIKNNHVDFKEGYLYVLRLRLFNGHVKENMIAMYQSSISGKYQEDFIEADDILIWKDELDELENWYDLEYQIVDCFEYEGKHPKGVVDFVNTFYEIKNTQKGAKKQGAKLLLNSSYGKLAQKIEQQKVEVIIEENITKLRVVGVEIDDKHIMSVLLGSRITALARVDLMRHIRIYTRNNPRKYFCYCDTDSIHTLLESNIDIDDKEIGKYKCEGIYQNGIYLAPKTYLLNNNDEYETHCKGVNTNVVSAELHGHTWKDALDIFKPKKEFKTLCGLNVRGGKALIYLDKMIVRDIPICMEDINQEIIVGSDDDVYPI